ncbi:hypothetical protein [Duganella sp. P38]|uniref:hypothetical protein n=1 Tax=Duganella sp. P38 TaxID=3423949 RepID=UPI003D7B90CB
MTRSEHNGQDDELDAFMAGQDALSRQLAALSQPESTKGVDDAIMASIAAQLALEAARPAGGQPGLRCAGRAH